MSTLDIVGGGSTKENRSSTIYTLEQSQQAVQQNVLRELYKQLELLLLKKKVGDGKVTLRQGLLVSIPQVERVSTMTSSQVTHQLEVISNVLVKISTDSLHSVCEVLIKMCDTYLDDPYNMVSQTEKKGKLDLPSYCKDDIESDLEVVLAASISDSLLVTVNDNINNNSNSNNTSDIENNNNNSNILNNSNGIINNNENDESNLLSSSTSSLSSTASSQIKRNSQTTTTSHSKHTIQFEQLRAFPIYKQVSDDTPLYHLLNTLYLILSSHVTTSSTGISTGSTQLSTLPPKTITFFFNLLQFTLSATTRYRAATCLQVISIASPDVIAQLFITRLQTAKNDDFYREYSTFQRAAKFLEFGFNSPTQIEATSQYFAKILIEMEKASRAVFQQSICFTIIRCFPKMFNNINNSNIQIVPSSFWPIVQKIYDNILKWSKKSKLKQLCIKTLAVITCVSEEFMLSRGTDLLNLIISASKEVKSRRPYLEALITYFIGVKRIFQTEAKAPFYQAQVSSILPVLLPRKSHPGDLVLLLEVLMSMGRFSLSIVVHKHILAVLSQAMPGKPSEYTPECKAVVLRMLASLNTEFSEGMRAYDRTLWQTLDHIYSSYEGDTSPLRYILLCFPVLCSPETHKDIADKITKWTWHADSEVAAMATAGIIKYLGNQPQISFPAILFQMLTYITNYFGEPAGLTKVVRNISMITEEFINLHYLANGERRMSAQIDPATWKNLRETLEGVALFLLSSQVQSLWSQVLELIKLTGHQIFREIDRDNPMPYLADYLPHSVFLEKQPEHLDTVTATYGGFSSLIPTFYPDLAYFLQIHDGSLQNSINWAWTRLRKRWHPKSQPNGWKNNLAFLLLSLRLNSDQPELTAIEDQLLTEVLNGYFQEREGRSGEEMASLISELSLYLHRSCYDTVFRYVEQERGRDLKKKKKEVFYIQEHVIIYISQLAARLSIAEYDGVPSIRTALREVTYFWITNNQIFQSLNSSIKNYCAKLFVVFLNLDSTSSIPKGEISLNKPSYTKLIFQCLQSLSENIMTNENTIQGELELNIQKAFNVLVTVGCLDDFKKEVVPFLINSLGHGQHIHQLIADNLGIFLRRSPKYLNEYIERSFDNEKQPVTSLSFLRALVANFTQFNTQWSHECQPERLVHLILFHMGSSHLEARNLACQLSNQLVRSLGDEQIYLTAHFQSTMSDNIPNYIYNRSALLYSNSMSSKYQWMTPLLFEEAETCYQHFPLTHKQTLLTMLAPWSRNFFWIVSGGDGTVGSKSVEVILESLLSITLQAKSITSTHSSLEVLWGELAASGDSSGQQATYNVYKRIIDFLKEKYHSDKLQPDTRNTAKMIISMISRRSSTHWMFVVEYLMKSLRHFHPLPASPVVFVQEFLNNFENPKEEQISHQTEEAYMFFLEDMTFEFQLEDVATVPKLVPVLLVNSLLVYGPSSTSPSLTTNNIPVGKRILDHLLLSLVIRQPTLSEDLKKEAEQIIQSNWKDWTMKERNTIIKLIQSSLGDTVCEIFELLVLQCAIRSNDHSVSMSAIDWYEGIRTTIGSKKDGMDGLLGLCCGIWRSCIVGDIDKMYRIITVLNSIIANNQRCIHSDTSYSIIIRLGSILLHTSYLSQFNSALTLLNRTINALTETPQLRSRITEEMIDILGAGMRTEQVVNRGIGHPQTSLLTLWFAKECAEFAEKGKNNLQLNAILSTVLLNASCMAAMSPEDKLTLDFLDYLFDSPSKKLSANLELLYLHYHHVSKSTSQPPCSPIEFIKILIPEFVNIFHDGSPDFLSNLMRSVTGLVRSLMESSREKDAAFLLEFIDEMINNIPSAAILHPTYLTDFITVIIEVCQRSSSAATREKAQNLIPFIIENLPQGLPIGVFDFVKPYTGGFESVTTSMFGFETELDLTNNLYTSLYLINTYIFAVPADSQINTQMKRTLETYHKENQYTMQLPVKLTPFAPTIKRKPNVPTTSRFVLSNHVESLVQPHVTTQSVAQPSPPIYKSHNRLPSNTVSSPTTPPPATPPIVPTTPPPHISKSYSKLPLPTTPPPSTPPPHVPSHHAPPPPNVSTPPQPTISKSQSQLKFSTLPSIPTKPPPPPQKQPIIPSTPPPHIASHPLPPPASISAPPTTSNDNEVDEIESTTLSASQDQLVSPPPPSRPPTGGPPSPFFAAPPSRPPPQPSNHQRSLSNNSNSSTGSIGSSLPQTPPTGSATTPPAIPPKRKPKLPATPPPNYNTQ